MGEFKDWLRNRIKYTVYMLLISLGLYTVVEVIEYLRKRGGGE